MGIEERLAQAQRAEHFAKLRKDHEERMAGQTPMKLETRGRGPIQNLDAVRDVAWEYGMGPEDTPTRETAQAMLDAQPGYVKAVAAMESLKNVIPDLLRVRETGNAFSYDDPSGVGSTVLNREFSIELARMMKEDPLAIDDKAAARLFSARKIAEARRGLDASPVIDEHSSAIIEEKRAEIDAMDRQLTGHEDAFAA